MKYLIVFALLLSQVLFAQTSDEGVLKVGSRVELLKGISLKLDVKMYSFQNGRPVAYGSEDQTKSYCTLFQRGGNTVTDIVPQVLTVNRSIRRQIQDMYYDAFNFESPSLSGMICWGQNGQPPTLQQIRNAFGSYFRF